MRRIETFAGAVGFAAVAAVAWIPWAMLAAPFAGGGAALSHYLVAVTTAYVAMLAAGQPRATAVTALALLLGAASLLATTSVAELALALAVMIGVLRSGVLSGPPTPRALIAELLLVGGGLTLARVMAAPSAVGVAAGLWCFFLVQSLYFLGGDPRERADAPADAFETAYRRAVELLELP